MSKIVAVLATMDTKGIELAYVVRCLSRAGVDVKTVDVGTLAEPTTAPGTTPACGSRRT